MNRRENLNREQILQLHPDPQIAFEVATEMLDAALSDARAVIESVHGLTFASPPGQAFKANCRAVLDRTSEAALLRKDETVWFQSLESAQENMDTILASTRY